MQEGLCLVCSSAALEPAVDLGRTVPANRFLEPGEPGNAEKWHPLRVGVCRDCGHVQLLEHVPPEELFSHYLYVSSASSTLSDHLHGLAARIVAQLRLPPDALVVDVGSNDGTLLEGFAKAGIRRRVGVDPAENLAALARQKGAEVIVGYFGESLAAQLRGTHGLASVLTLTNTLPHVPDLGDLMRGVDHILADDGVVVLEAHYVGDLVELCAFDTVYHEHVSYWSLRPLRRLLAAHGFEVFDVERLPIHHGQLRAWVARRGTRPATDRVEALASEEAERGLGRIETYRALGPRIQSIRRDLVEQIDEVRRAGGRVAAYGAPAKGSTLLSYFGLGPDQLDYVADRNPLKQGRLTPGTHVPIVAPERILEDRPDLVVVLAWNFADEIAQQLAPYLREGGRMVVPIPSLRDLELPA